MYTLTIKVGSPKFKRMTKFWVDVDEDMNKQGTSVKEIIKKKKESQKVAK